MTTLTRRRLLMLSAAAIGSTAGTPVIARPQRYVLDTVGSQVGFRFRLLGVMQAGQMPVRQADITIDPDNLTASRVDVRLDAAAAETGLDYATSALKAPGVLDVAHYPEIRFQSTKVQLAPDGRLSGGASLRGLLSLRGVTRPITLQAGLFRMRGSAPDDFSRLSVVMTGALSRASFGATGYADLVADRVELDIIAAISARF